MAQVPGSGEGRTRGDSGPECGALKTINPEAWAALLKCSERRCVAKGSVLFSQGESHKGAYFILNGLVKTYYLSPMGKAMTMAHWSEGAMVGGPDFFERSTHIWSAAALADSVVLVIGGAELDYLVNRFPDLARYIIRTLTFKMQWLSELLQITSTESVTDRLAHLLVKLAEMYGTQTEKGLTIPQDFSQEELANMVGASRQWVNLTLSRLHRAQLIYSVGREITLRDVEGLKQTGLVASGASKDR
jgi:CRP-like cAMP-binding protein